jgi:hypothetical protein
MSSSTLCRKVTRIVVFTGGVLLGAITTAMAQAPPSPTEPGAATAISDRTASYDSTTSSGVPPDENPPAGGDQLSAPSALTFSYYQVSGTTLRPRTSSTEYAYDGVGCTHVSAGTGTGRILNTELPLPDGAVIKYLRVYYRDTSVTNGVEGYITRYQAGTGAADLVHTGSSDAFAGGYGFTVSAELSEIVNNTSYAYTLIGWPDDANVANQICGLRVAYYAPDTAPGAPTLNPPVVSGNTVQLSWTPSDGTAPTSFVLTATNTSGTVLATVPLTATSASFSGVASGTYLVSIVALNNIGSSPPSNTVTVIVP